ncbi:MAG TPA: hypothetical protein VMZ91_01185 [Candidatus Paceibacterota bacterium]|nr:hypothetical protein [Candidatus Paceibacterota bacterium]
MSNKFDVSEFEEIDFEEFEGIIEKLKEGEADCPCSKNEISRYVKAFIDLKDESKYLKEEYKPFIKEKYINPIDEKIKNNTEEQELIKQAILRGLNEIDEKKANFPGIGKIAKTKVAEKILYPTDEKDFAEKILREDPNSDFIVLKPSLNKKKIMEFFKNEGEVPFQELSVEEKRETVRITSEKKEN